MRFIAILVLLASMGVAHARGAADCEKKKQTQPASVRLADGCNRSAPKVVFLGKKKLEKPIRVVVCHPYWDRLNVGTLGGRKTKWWGPTINHMQWSADLPAAASACKVFWIKPGSVVSTKASCVNRIIATKKMLAPGKYVME